MTKKLTAQKPKLKQYTVGGTIRPEDDKIYIEREADEELLAHCLEGDFSYILTARQMGKSSLMVRTFHELNQRDGMRAVIVDMSGVGGVNSLEEFYFTLLRNIIDKLDLELDLDEWWSSDKNVKLVPTERFKRYLERELLPTANTQITIFMDEIESLRHNAPFSVDNFFAQIRAMYNARATEPVFRKLAFVFIGFAHPSELIQDDKITPFNIGTRIQLGNFTNRQALQLADGMGLSAAASRQIIQAVLDWTGGHPYLSQRLCQALTKDSGRLDNTVVEETVKRLFLNRDHLDDNIAWLQKELLSKGRGSEILTTYYEIYSGQTVTDDDENAETKEHLKLSGIVRLQNGRLIISNKIYHESFNDEWIDESFRNNHNYPLQIVEKRLQERDAVRKEKEWANPPEESIATEIIPQPAKKQINTPKPKKDEPLPNWLEDALNKLPEIPVVKPPETIDDAAATNGKKEPIPKIIETSHPDDEDDDLFSSGPFSMPQPPQPNISPTAPPAPKPASLIPTSSPPPIERPKIPLEDLIDDIGDEDRFATELDDDDLNFADDTEAPPSPHRPFLLRLRTSIQSLQKIQLTRGRFLMTNAVVLPALGVVSAGILTQSALVGVPAAAVIIAFFTLGLVGGFAMVTVRADNEHTPLRVTLPIVGTIGLIVVALLLQGLSYAASATAVVVGSPILSLGLLLIVGIILVSSVRKTAVQTLINFPLRVLIRLANVALSLLALGIQLLPFAIIAFIVAGSLTLLLGYQMVMTLAVSIVGLTVSLNVIRWLLRTPLMTGLKPATSHATLVAVVRCGFLRTLARNGDCKPPQILV